MKTAISFLPLIALLVFTASSLSVADDTRLLAPTDAAGPCTRFAAGSVANNPPDLFSKNGVLKVNCPTTQKWMRTAASYTASRRRTVRNRRHCMYPGDRLVVNVTNNLRSLLLRVLCGWRRRHRTYAAHRRWARTP